MNTKAEAPWVVPKIVSRITSKGEKRKQQNRATVIILDNKKPA